MDILTGNLLRFLRFLRVQLFLQLLLLFSQFHNMTLQVRNEHLRKALFIILKPFLLRIVPDLHQQRQDHLVVCELLRGVGCSLGPVLGWVGCELLDDARELGGPVGGAVYFLGDGA